MTKVDLGVTLSSLKLKNPLITASGTCGNGEELQDYFDIERLGALTVKGITVKPSRGNSTPRIAETPAGLLNSIGLENPGIDSFIEEKLEIIDAYQLPVIVNISGHSLDDFAYLAERLAPYPQFAALEVNVSCPNIAGGGMVFGTNEELVYKVTRIVKENYSGTVIVKLSPNVTDIVTIARAVEEGGADIISMINTLLGMAIDVDKQAVILGNTFGGLSGPAIKPVALRMVYQVAQVVDIPIIGMGGIMTARDALEFIMAGASAVAVGTATLINPDAALKIIDELEAYLIDKGIDSIKELIGKLIK
ncbi:MAG: dihydroorotate dehydrogenase [Firmicutes bacterium]|nr:dihydroorotate dehydrogenase [Bacillota bacterium]